MALTKFKVCPTCGEHNPPELLECKNDETDLTGVKVVDEAILATVNAAAGEGIAPDNSRSLVKTCDCGTANLPQARKCSSCGEDISDVPVTAAQSSPEAMRKVVLRSMDASFTFPLDKPVTVVGREAGMQQYLETKVYVSRKHAKFTYANDEVYIENMSSTNHTYVNDTLIPSDAPTLLKNGDEIGLGGKQINGKRQSQAAYFVIEVAI